MSGKVGSAFIALFIFFVMSFGVVGAQTGAGDSPVATPTVPAEVPGDGDPVPVEVDPGSIPSLPDFLETLAGPSGSILIGILVSIFSEKWPWFKRQTSDTKLAIALSLSAGVAIVAHVLLVYVPAEFWGEINAFWVIIATTALAWLGNQGWFQLAVRPKDYGHS